MARVANTSTNGIISSTLISKIIDEVNHINEWLNELGYEKSNDGMVDMYRKLKNASKPTTDTRGADDFRVYTATVHSSLQKGKVDHGDVKVPLPKGRTPSSVTATIQCDTIPAFATLKSIGSTEMIFEITSIKKPNANKDITLHITAIALEVGTAAQRDY